MEWDALGDGFTTVIGKWAMQDTRSVGSFFSCQAPLLDPLIWHGQDSSF